MFVFVWAAFFFFFAFMQTKIIAYFCFLSVLIPKIHIIPLHTCQMENPVPNTCGSGSEATREEHDPVPAARTGALGKIPA